MRSPELSCQIGLRRYKTLRTTRLIGMTGTRMSIPQRGPQRRGRTNVLFPSERGESCRRTVDGRKEYVGQTRTMGFEFLRHPLRSQRSEARDAKPNALRPRGPDADNQEHERPAHLRRTARHNRRAVVLRYSRTFVPLPGIHPGHGCGVTFPFRAATSPDGIGITVVSGSPAWDGSDVRVGIPACVTYAFVSRPYSLKASRWKGPS